MKDYKPESDFFYIEVYGKVQTKLKYDSFARKSAENLLFTGYPYPHFITTTTFYR